VFFIVAFSSCNTSDASNKSTSELLFSTHCTKCHGSKGNLGISGAADLTKSILTNQEAINIITKGKGNMPSFREILSTEDIEKLATYVGRLKQ